MTSGSWSSASSCVGGGMTWSSRSELRGSPRLRTLREALPAANEDG